MSYCRRCSRALLDGNDETPDEDALQLDLADAIDETLAAVWDGAFDLAIDHGNAVVGMEHLLHAMTLVPSAAALLTARGVNVEGLRSDSARVLAAGAEDEEITEHDVAPELDLETSMELTVACAEDDMRHTATLDDLLHVLSHYSAGHADIDRLIGWLRRATPRRVAPAAAMPAGERHAPSNDARRQPKPAARPVPSVETLVGARIGGAAPFSPISLDPPAQPYRVTRGERRVDAVSHESASARMATADAAALAALEARLDARFAALERSVTSSTRAAPPAAGAALQSIAEAQLAALDRLSERLQRMAAAQERTEEMLRARDARPREAPVRASGDRSADMLGRLARTLETQQEQIARLVRCLEAREDHLSREGGQPGTRMPARPATGNTSRDGIDTASDRGEDPARRDALLSRRSEDIGYEGRRPAARRPFRLVLSRLVLARIVRRRVGTRPRRRERSWWPLLTRPAALRQARRRGGRYRPFGERFGHRPRGRVRDLQGNPGSARPVAHALPDRRFYLALDHDIVDAPSIGPRTAERLRAAGIFTVRDLLAADVADVARRVAARHVTAAVLADWQDQARLVCTVPFLRGTHAQLLVGAGYRTPQRVAAADQGELMSAILRFATTREGQSVLRNGPPPEPEKVESWVRNAGEADLARAA